MKNTANSSGENCELDTFKEILQMVGLIELYSRDGTYSLKIKSDINSKSIGLIPKGKTLLINSISIASSLEKEKDRSLEDIINNTDNIVHFFNFSIDGKIYNLTGTSFFNLFGKEVKRQNNENKMFREIGDLSIDHNIDNIRNDTTNDTNRILH